MLIDGSDVILLNYIDTTLDSLSIKYTKLWQNKFNSYIVYDCEPRCTDGFVIKYKCECFKELHYINKIAKDFIDKREYLERCLCASK